MTTSGSNSVVECQLPKLDVAGSSPVSRSKKSILYGFPSLQRFAPFAPFADSYITPSAFSSALTAPLRRSNEALVYSF